MFIAIWVVLLAQGLMAWRAHKDPWFARHRWLRRLDVVPSAIVGVAFGVVGIIGGVIVVLRRPTGPRAVDHPKGADLGVVPCQVGDAAGGWPSDCGVVAVMVVAVKEAVKCSSARRF